MFFKTYQYLTIYFISDKFNITIYLSTMENTTLVPTNSQTTGLGQPLPQTSPAPVKAPPVQSSTTTV